ncbi:MAG: phosphoserine phosphatase SerB [Bradymonadia bacterium]
MSSTASEQHTLVRVTGQDVPGIAAALTGALVEHRVPLRDIEQVVVQGCLILCLVVDGLTGECMADLRAVASRFELEIDARPIAFKAPRPSAGRMAITAIGDGLDAEGVQQLTEVLAQEQANIAQAHRLSTDPLHSMELICELPAEMEPGALRRRLLAALSDKDVDIAVQPDRLTRRRKRLIVFDMDSTLIQAEVIDELARAHGVYEEVSAITHRAMAGELDFEASLRARVSRLEGLSVTRAREVAEALPLTPGARELIQALKALGFTTAVISGGFTFAARMLQARLGLDDAFANTLEVQSGVITGQLKGAIVTPQRKADLLDTLAQREGILLEQAVAVGDGANDLEMLARAGLGIAFHAKPRVYAAADTALSAGGLDRVLYLLGLRQWEVEELLSEADAGF